MLAEDPDNPGAHALHAICLIEMKKFKEATDAANMAIGLAPDAPFGYYVASRISDARNQLKQAEAQIQQAISIDHTNPDYFAQLASIHIQQKKWQAALVAAEAGLEMDPENVACTNLRAIAMVKLGRNSEAGAAIQSALEKSPEDAVSHANMGWSLLNQGKPKDAMPHFKEALRLEPNMEWARAGIIEAMKSQYFIYRMLLSWFLWSSKLDSRTLTMILIGGYIGANVASNLAENNPVLRPFLIPLIVVYIAFVIMTWIAVPMFNLLLRFNKFGRLVLSDEEKRISTLVGTCLVVAVSLVIASFSLGYSFFLAPALAVGLLTPIIATYYQSDPGWPRAAHGLLVLGILAFALISIGCAIGGYTATDQVKLTLQGLLNMSITPLVVIGVGGQFGVNFLGMAKPMKGTNKGFLVWLIGGSMLAVAVLCVVAFIALIVFGASSVT